MGYISLEGLEFYSHHGYYDEERKIGNKFSVDISIEVDFDLASHSDDLDQTINYEKVYAIVKSEMEQPSKLLEHIIQRIQSSLVMKFPQIQSLVVSISKYNPPIGGVCKKAKVTISKDFRI